MSMDERTEAHGAKEGSDFAGCWDIRGPGIDALFAGDLSRSHTALSAIQWTDRAFHAGFPGWELYRTVVSGDRIHWRKLEAYAIGMARALTRARTNKQNSHPLIARRARRNDWIAQAARDALFIVIHGKEPMPGETRAEALNVWPTNYRKVRDSVAGGMTIGLETYRAMLHVNFYRVREAEMAA